MIDLRTAAAALQLSGKQLRAALHGSAAWVETKYPGGGVVEQIDESDPAYTALAELTPAERKSHLNIPMDPNASN